MTVTSNTPSVTDWSLSYFGPRRNAAATSSPYTGPVAQALNGLPRHGITLGHDVKANADFLAGPAHH